MDNFQEKVSFIWSVADLLRGDYKQSDYGKVILPLTILRRLDCVMEPTRAQVAERADQIKHLPEAAQEKVLARTAGLSFFNTSPFSFGPRADIPVAGVKSLLDSPDTLADDLERYIALFSKRVQDILKKLEIASHIKRLERGNILFKVIKRFTQIDLHPEAVSNLEMGYMFEELIRRFSEQSKETAGEHFTPREVIRLMVNLIFCGEEDALTVKGIAKTLYDPACGTGGMLSVADNYLRELNPDSNLTVFGQELNPEAFAICNADMLMKGWNPDNIKFGNSFTEDELSGETFDYMLANPPFGVSWDKVKEVVKAEHTDQGYNGRFGPGLPRVNDGSLLFLLHMISKMKRPEDGGSRLAIVFNGSPLFTGAAGSGESNIRRWIIENDWLDAIVALPDQMFYNTGINTYIWIVTNRKAPQRKGKVQLVNAVSFFQKMRKSLGDKRKELSEDQIAEITRLYDGFEEGEHVKIFDNKDFGFARITVERPLRLNFQASPDRIARLDDERAFAKLATSKKKTKDIADQEIALGKAEQERIKAAVAKLDESKLYKSRKAFLKDLQGIGVKLSAPLKKAVLSALSEQDPTSKVCKDKHGNPEPDTSLRDNENVPLTEDIDAYFEREVEPHVPDAWIKEEAPKIGYEIPFTRHFYEYTPPRPLKVIEAEIRALEGEIRGMLEEVLA